MSTEGAGPCGSEFSGGLGPLPLSPVEVGDLILQPREHVLSLGWRNREQLYPESQVRAYVASAVAAERERCARTPLTRQQIDDVMTQHYPLSSLLREEVDAFEACVRDIERLHGIGA